MCKRNWAYLLLCLLLMPVTLLAGMPLEVRESTINFKIDPNAKPSELKKLNALFNPGSVQEIETLHNLKLHSVKFKNIKGFEKAFSDQLFSTGAVLFSEPDAIVPHALIPNDPDYGAQWHHPTINSPGAWDQLTGPADADLNAVKVCVLDTGVDTDHPDLVANLLLPGFNTRTELVGDVEDAHGHGTGTIGVVGAVGDNDIGVSGMAWKIKIIPVRINISDGNSDAYYTDMAQGIEYCADQGGKVANLSYGGAQSYTIDTAAAYLRASGGLLFMSAGNGGTHNSTSAYPDFTSFVSVGATDQNDVLTSWTETGPFVDIVAPGSSIRTTYTNGSYTYYSGTSFSSPMAAGLAALVYSVNPNFTPAQVENYIFSTAVDLGNDGDDDYHGHGRIDAATAVVSALGSNPPSPNDPPTATASANPANGTAPLMVQFEGSLSSDAPDGYIDAYSWNFGDGNTQEGSGNPGIINHTYTDAGTYNATLTVTDNESAVATSSTMVISVSPDPAVLETPANLTASLETGNVTLNWSHNGLGGLDYFEIWRARKVRGKYDYSQVGSSDINQHVDQVARTGTYRYRIRARGIDNSLTVFSNTAQVNVDSLSPPDPDPDPGLGAPVLSASSSGLTATLWWTHNCPNGETCRYHIERGNTKTKGQINFTYYVSGDGTSYGPILEPESGTYFYKVYATTNNGDTSADSNVVNVRLK